MDSYYEPVDVPDDQAPPQNCRVNESVYTAPIVSQILKQNYYHLPQVKPSSSEKLTANQAVKKISADEVRKEITGHSKATCCLIIVSLLMVAISILTLAAISLGMHNLLKDGHKDPRAPSVTTGAEVMSEEITNYSQLANEIHELKLQLKQMASDARRNNSQLASQLELVRYDITQANTDIGRINTRLATSHNPYQNCRKDKTTCTLSNAGTTTPYCLTPTQEINISNHYTLDISCELSRWYQYDAHEVATLYEVTPGGSSVVCKCSVAYPNPTGHTTVTISSSRSIKCSLVITRCPVS